MRVWLRSTFPPTCSCFHHHPPVMVSSTSKSSESSSSDYYSCALSLHTSSSSEWPCHGRNSTSTSMTSLESCATPTKRCSCDLTNENELRKLYLDHARSTEGLWHGPLPIVEWKERFMPSGETTSCKFDLTAVPGVHNAVTLVCSLLVLHRSLIILNVTCRRSLSPVVDSVRPQFLVPHSAHTARTTLRTHSWPRTSPSSRKI